MPIVVQQNQMSTAIHVSFKDTGGREREREDVLDSPSFQLENKGLTLLNENLETDR